MNITDASFQKEVAGEKSMPVLVDFWAPWCGPCRILSPVVEELEKEYQGQIKIVKINVDENQTDTSKFNVMSIPTLIFFKNGEPVKNMVGAQGKDALKNEIERIISS